MSRVIGHNRYIHSFTPRPSRVGSRAGARTVGSGGLSKPFALGLSPAPLATSPAPASSNGAGGFPALRFPDDFSPGVMGPLGQQRFRDRRPVPTPPGPVEVGLRPGKDPLPQVLPIMGGFIISPRPPMSVEECPQQGRFAPRTLLRFAATTSPSATLSPSADFPGSPVLRPTWLRRCRGGARRASPVARCALVTVLSLPPRRRVPSRQPRCDGPCCLRPPVAGSASGSSHFRGHLCVHLRYGPVTRRPSRG